MKIRHLFERTDVHEPEHLEDLKKTGFYGKRAAGCLFQAQNTGRLMFGLRSSTVEQPGTYGLFGGALNPDESPAPGAEREAREETRYAGAMHLKPLSIYAKGSFRYFNFLAIVPKEFTPTLNWENDGYSWVQFGDWPKPLHFGAEALIAKYLHGFAP